MCKPSQMLGYVIVAQLNATTKNAIHSNNTHANMKYVTQIARLIFCKPGRRCRNLDVKHEL
jgi:hypothetical protein